MARLTGAYRAGVSSFSAVLGSWPVQLGLVFAMVLAAAALMDLSMRAFTGQLHRRPGRRTPGRLLGRRPGRRTSRARPGAGRRLPAAPTRRPLQSVALDLRRLGRELALVSAGTPAAHRRGLQAAYDDVLIEAAATLEVPHRLPACDPGEERELERLRLLTALTDAGLVVSPRRPAAEHRTAVPGGQPAGRGDGRAGRAGGGGARLAR